MRSSLLRSLIIQCIRSIVEKSSIRIDKLSNVVVLYRPIVVYINESTNVLDSLFNNCLINDEYTLNTFLPRDISIGLLDLPELIILSYPNIIRKSLAFEKST